MKQPLPIYIILVFMLQSSESHRILGLFPYQGKSHMMLFERLMRELAERGHEVDVLSHFPLEKPPPRYNNLSVRGTLPIFVNNVSVEYARESMGTYRGIMDFVVHAAGTTMCTAILNSTAARSLKITNKHYDIIITEIFGSDCMLGFAHSFRVPVIGIISSSDVPWGGERIGNPDNPAYIPNYLASFRSRMNFLQRLENTVLLLYAKITYHLKSLIPSNNVAHSFFGSALPDLQQLIYNFSLILVNSHFSINFPRPAVPNFIEIAGLHITPPKRLSQHFEDILNVPSQYKGVIYLSTGSMVLTETLPIYKLRAFFEAFKELPYRVLWKATRDRMPKELDIPSNIYFESWMPQTDILCHPNVKLFVSHGGLMGTQEAIYCGVPRLGIPFFADQTLNLKASEALGVAIMLNYDNITKESVLTTAKVLLEDHRYTENSKTISKLFMDRPLPPLETAIYWIEYIIRYNGAPHLKSVGAELPWYKYFLLDVITIILVVLFILLFITYYIIRYILIQLFRKKLNEKSKQD